MHLRKAIQLKPGLAEACFHLGVTLAQQTKHAEAVEWLRRAMQLRPAFASAYSYLGSSLAAQRVFDEAEQA
jgi:Flp pilus assembly protein TadD